MPGPAEKRVVYQSAFDALARAVDLDRKPELIEELRGLGYDRRAEVTEYPPSVLQAVLLRMVSREYPALPVEVGCRELGRTAFQAYRSTLVGQVAMAAVSLLSVERALRLAVRSFRTVANFSEHEVLPSGKERELIYRVRHTILPPEYTQGLLEGLMVATRNHNVVVTLVDRTTDPLEFRLTW